jgi:tubulin--tyrosine ligase
MQRSWIGKAHFVGQVVKPTYFRPGTLHQDDGTTHDHPLSDNGTAEEWVLVEGTPATCTQLGLYHFFQDRGPVDLVVSGPNYGRNSTALFSLSSGTIGGAMEAATHRRKAIALSYAFYSRDHDPVIIAGASRLSVKIIEHLYANWGEDVDLYSINVPLIEGVENNKVMYTNVLQNYWSSGSSFQETDAETNDTKPEVEEAIIRHQKEDSHGNTRGTVSSTRKSVSFKWAPKFTDIHKSVAESAAGNDGWALGEGYTR